MSLVGIIKGAGPSGFGSNSTAEQVTEGLDLKGKTYLVTGCNSGLGLETLRVLSARGAHVIAAARSEEKAQAALAEAGAEGTPVACELSEPASVRACVDAVKGLGRPLDAVIANAGIMALPKLEVVHGYERQFFTNHMGHFLLVTGLLDALSEAGRVVMLSSAAHTGAPREGIQLDNLDGAKGYSGWRNYGQSKLANLLFARELAARFKAEGSARTANAVHPGVIRTNLVRHMTPLADWGMSAFGPIFFKTIPQGAATQVYVATHPAVEGVSGEYFYDCNIKGSSRLGRDAALAKALWARSEEIAAAV